MIDFESESGQIDNRVVQDEGAGFSSEKLILILKNIGFGFQFLFCFQVLAHIII